MSKVINLNTKNIKTTPHTFSSRPDQANPEIIAMIHEELSYISSDKKMIGCILEKMKPFISAFDVGFDLDLEIELTKENEKIITQIIPSVQNLQARFDCVILSLISERILHEMDVYCQDTKGSKQTFENNLKSTTCKAQSSNIVNIHQSAPSSPQS